MENKSNISHYYDNRIEEAINDYFINNKRLIEALKFSIQNIPADTTNILDLGCGIGWTSYEYAKHFPNSQVTGFDISEKSIEFARSFFSHKNLNFLKGDISLLSDYIPGKFEIVTLIDVYEHIEKSRRPVFYNLINEKLAENGKVLITCPSVIHQNYLRKHKPEELQPIDENIFLDDLQRFSSYIDAEISFYKYKSIYHTDDYIQAILNKNIGKQETSVKDPVRVKVQLDRQFDKYRRFSRYQGNIYSETINRNKKFWLFRHLKNFIKNSIC